NRLKAFQSLNVGSLGTVPLATQTFRIMEIPAAHNSQARHLARRNGSTDHSLNSCGGMVGATGIEPVTPSMSTRCSPAELRALELSDGLRFVYRLQSGRARMPGPDLDRESGRQHLVHFADQFAKMDRLGQHFGILRCFGIGI